MFSVTLPIVQFALRLFRQTFEYCVRKGAIPPLPATVPPELQKVEGGVYVAAFENPGRKPRGKVGFYLPTKSSLAEEIQTQALTLTETFPFRKEDLPYLTYELFFTRAPRFLADLSSLRSDAGLLVRSSLGRQGVSLPGVFMRSPQERFLEACERANIDQRIDTVRFYMFDIDVVREGVS